MLGHKIKGIFCLFNISKFPFYVGGGGGRAPSVPLPAHATHTTMIFIIMLNICVFSILEQILASSYIRAQTVSWWPLLPVGNSSFFNHWNMCQCSSSRSALIRIQWSFGSRSAFAIRIQVLKKHIKILLTTKDN